MDKKDLAYKDYQKGLKYKEIAEKYEVSLSTVKSWASRHWKDKGRNLQNQKVATKEKKLQPRGAPKGNKNAVGKTGGAPARNQNNYKHGAYEKIYWDTLDEEERTLIFEMQFEEEQSLIDQIRLLTVRERRLMKSIAKNKDIRGGLALDSVVKRKLEIKGNIIEDDNQVQEETTTKTISTFEVLMKLEAELTRVQSKKTKCIEALNKIRMERQKQADGEVGNELVDDWISGVVGGADDGES